MIIFLSFVGFNFLVVIFGYISKCNYELSWSKYCITSLLTCDIPTSQCTNLISPMSYGSKNPKHGLLWLVPFWLTFSFSMHQASLCQVIVCLVRQSENEWCRIATAIKQFWILDFFLEVWVSMCSRLHHLNMCWPFLLVGMNSQCSLLLHYFFLNVGTHVKEPKFVKNNEHMFLIS